jgi:DNA (cytosine-5)-methyltransferase 3A
MKVLSLFDGMSCGQLALQRAGIKVNQYFASEIDKYAIQVAMVNFPDTIQLGDITKVFAKDLPQIDLIIGGSPCQGFSFAGKGLNFDDPRSKLFFEFVRLVKECKPKYFLLENVKMKKEYELVISNYLGVAPIEINSALVSAQNRVRLYWTNIYNKPFGLFNDMYCAIPQPKDKGILLKDILESDVLEKYYLSDKMLNYLNTRKDNFNAGKINYKTGDDLASCINANSGHIDISDNIIIDTIGKSRCFTAGGHSGVLHSQMDLIKCVAMRGRQDENGKYIQQLEVQENEKTNTLTEVQKDNLVFSYRQDAPNDINGKKDCLRANAGGVLRGVGIIEKSRIRRLTPVECERLQTVDDNYTAHVSDSQRYKMLGNGWTVSVVEWIFSFLPKDL